MVEFITDALKVCIVFTGLVVAYAEIAQATRLRGSGYAWVKYGLGVMGIYWSGYYLRSILNILVGNTHQVWVRGPLLVTLALVAAGALMSMRRSKK